MVDIQLSSVIHVGRGIMVFVARIMLFFSCLLLFSTPAPAAQSGTQSSSTSKKTLNQYIEKLKMSPADTALREKIIKLALTMKPAPIVPENVERNMARGAAFTKKADGASGYNKAIVEFEAAVNSAPWLAIAYFNLGVVQEKVGYYAEAIQNFNWYLMAAPNAKNARDVQNTVYALETELEADRIETVPASPLAKTAQAAPTPVVSEKMTLAIEPVTQHRIKPIPPKPKQQPSVPPKPKRKPSFIGNWFYKDTFRGEERTIQAFQISKKASGKIVAIAPKRAGAYISAIRAFTITDTKMKIAIHWRMTSVVGYWKIEHYDLTISQNGKKLTGSYSEKSVGGRNIARTRTLFRQ
jgi:tetratricopeptide (TPR) repeat protein